MTPPEGTFVAHVKAGTVQLPPPMARYCTEAKWTLFRINYLDEERLEFMPVLPDDSDDDLDTGFHSSLSSEGKLWIPAELREAVALGEHSVMMRIEDGVIRMYLRQVFKTLGFRP
jgi:bifunctional DNA-binding transcriptional regulator/antitoxin component of YhaV-PrlF toxin-antitoxin module